MKKNAGIILIIAGIMLIASALGVFIYNQADAQKADKASANVLLQFSEAVKAENGENSGDYGEMRSVEINGIDYIGIITIPSIDVELPVMAQWNYENLKISPCCYFGSVKTNDMVIAAHNYRRHFGNLSKLRVGDSVCFEDADGNKYNYVVGAIEVLSPTDVQEMVSSGFDLSLYTCTYGARERVTVRCQKITK